MNAQIQTQTKPVAPAAFTKVQTGLLQRKCACGGTPGVDGECAACRKKRLQRKATQSASASHIPPIVHDVLHSSGQPLDPATRTLMEPKFGHDFSQVRVHTDRKAAASAQAVNALAYTVGHDVVFGAGQYAPATQAGQRLFAHELTHVVQNRTNTLAGKSGVATDENSRFEAEAKQMEQSISSPGSGAQPLISAAATTGSGRLLQRLVIPDHVSCHQTGLRNPDLTGDEVVQAITDADADAIDLARQAEDALRTNLASVRAGDPVDANFDTILQEELGLTLTNARHFGLVEQQANRFARVRTTLESGYLRYMCRGGNNVSLVGCTAGDCGPNFAFTCPGNRLMVLCQAFWDTPDQRSATILHEPFHIWFHMARHEANALRRADASCFESFALRVAGRAAFASCAAHTAG